MLRIFNILSQKIKRRVIEKYTLCWCLYSTCIWTPIQVNTHIHHVYTYTKTMEYIQWLLLISCKTAKYIISNKIYSCFYYLLQLIKWLKRHIWHVSHYYPMVLLWLLANSKHILKTKNMDITLELIRKKSHRSLPGTLTRESKFTW